MTASITWGVYAGDILWSHGVPKSYGIVLIELVVLFLLHHGYMPFYVAKARKQYGISYPTLYADSTHKNAKEYNCVQRAHQNSLEYAYIATAFLLITSLRFPIAGAVLGAVYIVGRLLYFQGYAKGVPNKRLPGYGMSTITLLILAGYVSYIAVELLTS